MSIISIFSGTYCLHGEVVDKLAEKTGNAVVTDDELVLRASRLSDLSANKIARAFSAKTSVFNNFTHEKERSVAHLRYAVAETLADDTLLIDGFTSHLIPRNITHALHVCLIADTQSRIRCAETSEEISRKEATKRIRQHDEDRLVWVRSLRGSDDPWASELYDIVAPTDKLTADDVVDLILEHHSREVLQPTPASVQAAADFLVASRTAHTLAAHGHEVEVAATNGDVTLTINKHVLMLGRLEHELISIAERVEGVRSVSTRVGKDFYQPDIYRRIDFEAPSRVLLVDDEREFVQTLSERLEMRDVGSAVAYDGESALKMVAEDEPDVMILDLKMPGIDGIEVLRRVKRSHPQIEVIILTGHGSEEDCRVCMELGAFAYLRKPVDIDELSATLRKANEKARQSALDRERETGNDP